MAALHAACNLAQCPVAVYIQDFSTAEGACCMLSMLPRAVFHHFMPGLLAAALCFRAPKPAQRLAGLSIAERLAAACKHRRYTPPPRYEDVVTTLEPAPFADLFSEVEDFLVEVRLCLNEDLLWTSCACMPGWEAVSWLLVGSEGRMQHARR
jgi:hypothetical protein